MISTGQDLLYFNGIDATTGEYGIPPVSSTELLAIIQAGSAPDHRAELQSDRPPPTEQYLGAKEGVDLKNLAETGWGIVFADGEDPATRAALDELLDLRRQQAGPYFRVFEGEQGYQPNESKTKFLARHGVGPGPADPERVPYYLLLVGGPEAIPYQFQYQLDVQYAVGRISFDTPQEYANYAQSVIRAETTRKRLPRRAQFFAVCNPDDSATNLARTHLVEPLLAQLHVSRREWEFDLVTGSKATKAQLTSMLADEQAPSLLFTTSHGMGFPNAHALQREHQGALLCQDWPGPQQWHRAIPPDFYFAGEDVPDAANLLGMIALCFACYGAGTPQRDEFSTHGLGQPKVITPFPFVARLPQRLLSHPRGGALAVIGHVERAWSYSFAWPGTDAQTAVFQSTIERLLLGYPVGAALEFFNERYAELASDLNTELEEIEFGKQADPDELAGMWTANNDARSYALIGDPAVRVAAADETDANKRLPTRIGLTHRVAARRNLTEDSERMQREHLRDHHPTQVRRRLANRRRT